MSRAWMWFILSCKRYGKRMSFLLILLLLPVAVRGIRTAEESKAAEIRIAVFAEGMERKPSEQTASGQLPLERILAYRLTGGAEESGDSGDSGDSLVQFYLCESEQQVKDDVASKRAECGYVIGENLRQKLKEKNFKRSIRVFSAPSTVAADLSTEVVFSVLMEVYDGELLTEYVRDSEIFAGVAAAGSAEREALAAQAAELYEVWLHNGSTFRFVSDTGSQAQSGVGTGAAARENRRNQDSVFPVRGIVAVYIFIIGLYAAAMNLADKKKGLFLAIPYGFRSICRIAAMAAPVFLAVLSGMAALWSGGVLSDPGREVTAMLCYLAAVVLFSWVVQSLAGSPEPIYCLLPFFLIGSLIFCPVVIDIGRYLPAAEPVQKLFLPWYYLHFFG